LKFSQNNGEFPHYAVNIFAVSIDKKLIVYICIIINLTDGGWGWESGSKIKNYKK
jgi:hypothetical protein